MNFLYWQWFPLILFALICFIFYTIRYELSYFRWIKKYWFFEENKTSKIRRILYIIGFFFLAIALLDLRGPQEKIELDVPDQKTIIIIDASASMLTEDVRPNRFEKSLLIARHFIKKAVGHRISLVLFSDTQKKIVPFTDDIDLLDSRVAGLESANISNGGSNIAQALMESLQYFKADSGKNEISGNILLFTDGEENEEVLKLNIPENISLAVLGIGSLKGGVIPIRDKRGILRGYKNYNGERVVSKLNEKLLRDMANLVNRYKYWIVSSYALPTEEILEFFRESYEQILDKGTVQIFPVKLEYAVIPGVLLLILANLLSMAKTFKQFSSGLFFSLCLVLHLGFPGILANENELASKLDYNLWQRHKKGNLNSFESLKLAENLLESQDYQTALTLYEENIEDIEDASPEIIMNYAISLAKAKKIPEALKLFAKLSKRLKQEKYSHLSSEDLQQNILLALQNQANNNQSKEDQQNNKESKEGEEEEKSDQNGKDGNQKNQESNKQTGKENESKENKNQDNGQAEQEDRQDREDKKEEKASDNQERQINQSQENSTSKDREKEAGKMAKIPAILKQILDDDRELQKKFIDTSTKDSQKYQSKDW